MTSAFPDPLWPEEVEFQSDVAPSEWILPRLLPSILDGARGTPAGAIVPTGYPAYARVLHPLGEGTLHHPFVSWKENADRNGRIYHPLMQFQRIGVPVGEVFGPFRGSDQPSPGHLSKETCKVLYSTLVPWTSTPEVCWLGIWEGCGVLQVPGPNASVTLVHSSAQGDINDQRAARLQRMEEERTELAARARRAPTFDHPGRSYLLAKAPSSAICKLSRFPFGLTPNLVWPDDRAWCVGSEIDFDSTLVACSEECAAAILANDELEALPINAEDRLDIGGDVLNDQ
jgi:hypothetical protein